MQSSTITHKNMTKVNSSEPGATLDESQLKQDVKAGVTLGEQQETQTILPNEYNLTITNKRATSHMNDNPWDLQSMLGRQNYVTTLSWDTTAAAGSTLEVFDVITDLLQLDIASVPFQRFRYWRADSVTVHFQLTANRFLAGRLVACFLPSMTEKANLGILPQLNNAVLLQHVFLDPSGSSSVDLVIPFNYFQGWVNIQQNATLGQLFVFVMNPLVAATGTTPAVDLKVFVTFQNSEFKVPLPGGTSYTEALKMRRESFLLGGLMSGVAGMAGEAIKDVAKSILPNNVVGDVIGGLLDRPEDPSDPSPVVRKDQGYLSNSRGVAMIEKLTLEPSAQQLCDEEHFSTINDEMNIDYLLKKKYSYIITVPWNTTDTVGTILYSEPVGPLLNLLDDNTNSGTRLLDYISKMFHFWRGSLTYLVDVVGTQFHEGRLDFVFLPGQDAKLIDYKAMQSVYLGSLVIRNGQNAMSVSTPFLSTTPWKQVYYGGDLSNTKDVNRFDDFSSGYFQIVVSSVLRAPTNVAPNVALNIFQSAGPDYQVCTTSYYNSTLEPSGFPIGTVFKMRRESSLTPNLNNTAESIDKIPLATTVAETYDTGVKHFGEQYLSLRELAKRYTHLTSAQIDTTMISSDSLVEIADGLRPIITRITINANTFSQYPGNVMNMFRLFRGPMRFKIKLRTAYNDQLVSQSASNYGYVNFIPNCWQTPSNEDLQDLAVATSGYPYKTRCGAPLPMARYSNDQTAEFEVEFAYSYSTAVLGPKFKEVIGIANFSHFWQIDLICSTYITNIDITKASYWLEVFAAFGDTTHCGAFIGIPDLIPKTGTSGKSYFPDLWITPLAKETDEEGVVVIDSPRSLSVKMMDTRTQQATRKPARAGNSN